MTDQTAKSILIVDDDKFLVLLYQKKFTAAGWSVTTALSGNEALQKLRDGLEPSAVLFDMVMPGVDGIAFLDTVKKEKLAPHAALISLTNQSDPEHTERAKTLGIAGYIVKASSIPSEVVEHVTALAAGKK